MRSLSNALDPLASDLVLNILHINKFERDYAQPSLNYKFLNAYPISINAMPITYEGAQTLKCTVNFNFSRYVTGATTVKKASYPVL